MARLVARSLELPKGTMSSNAPLIQQNMDPALQSFFPCYGDETEAALLSALHVARQSLDTTTDADRPRLRHGHAAALKAFTETQLRQCSSLPDSPYL